MPEHKQLIADELAVLDRELRQEELNEQVAVDRMLRCRGELEAAATSVLKATQSATGVDGYRDVAAFATAMKVQYDVVREMAQDSERAVRDGLARKTALQARRWALVERQERIAMVEEERVERAAFSREQGQISNEQLGIARRQERVAKMRDGVTLILTGVIMLAAVVQALAAVQSYRAQRSAAQQSAGLGDREQARKPSDNVVQPLDAEQARTLAVSDANNGAIDEDAASAHDGGSASARTGSPHQ